MRKKSNTIIMKSFRQYKEMERGAFIQYMYTLVEDGKETLKEIER
jgi:hypothetical protein